MTVGAASGMNVILKTILDPGDEVVVFAPYFMEYGFLYPKLRRRNHCGAAGYGQLSAES